MIYYHLGLPKTGTSSIQKAAFDTKNSSFTWLCELNVKKSWKIHFISYLRGEIDIMPKVLISQEEAVFSFEEISNSWISPRLNKYVQNKTNYIVSTKTFVLNRLIEFHKFNFPNKDFCFVLGTRHINDWAVSYWLQSGIHFLKEITLDDFSEFASKEFDSWKNLHGFDVPILEYDLKFLNKFWKDNFDLDIDGRANTRSAQKIRRTFYCKVLNRIPYCMWRLSIKYKRFTIVEKKII